MTRLGGAIGKVARGFSPGELGPGPKAGAARRDHPRAPPDRQTHFCLRVAMSSFGRGQNFGVAVSPENKIDSRGLRRRSSKRGPGHAPEESRQWPRIVLSINVGGTRKTALDGAAQVLLVREHRIVGPDLGGIPGSGHGM